MIFHHLDYYELNIARVHYNSAIVFYLIFCVIIVISSRIFIKQISTWLQTIKIEVKNAHLFCMFHEIIEYCLFDSISYTY